MLETRQLFFYDILLVCAPLNSDKGGGVFQDDTHTIRARVVGTPTSARKNFIYISTDELNHGNNESTKYPTPED